MKTIVKDVRVRSHGRWLRVDVAVELTPEKIGIAYADKANRNKSGQTKQLGGLVIIRRIHARVEEETP